MNVIVIVVQIHTGGTDRVYVYTDHPSPFPPGVSNSNLIFHFEAQNGAGLNYALENFPGVPVETLDSRNGAKEHVRA